MLPSELVEELAVVPSVEPVLGSDVAGWVDGEPVVLGELVVGPEQSELLSAWENVHQVTSNAGINDTPPPPPPPPPQGCSRWGSGEDLTIQNVHALTLGTKLNCQISAVFGLADIPSFSFMLHSERLCVFSRTKHN